MEDDWREKKERLLHDVRTSLAIVMDRRQSQRYGFHVVRFDFRRE